ncbi:MAG: hypothetical protein KDJ90_14210 [Nitratireductor sp.]|mgnify:CR=1 FL=1|nr:hypothetical protein [Nitratireductor sp.]
MRVILLLWVIPLSLFWGWFALSFYDISFGTVFFSRELHDLVFNIYGNALGVPSTDVPSMVAWACIVDTGVIGSIAAFRWRSAWLPQSRAWLAGQFAGYGRVEPQFDDRPAGSVSRTRQEDERQGATALPDGPALPAE